MSQQNQLRADNSLQIIKSQIDSISQYIGSLQTIIQRLENQQQILINEYETIKKEKNDLNEQNNIQINNNINNLKNEAQNIINNGQVQQIIQDKQNQQQNILVDEYIDQKNDYLVYEDQQRIYSCHMIKYSNDNNNNKFYIVQLLKQRNLDNYFLYVRFGGIGSKGQLAQHSCENLENAIELFNKKIKEKTQQSHYEILEFKEQKIVDIKKLNDNQLSFF